jgi:hypothetical protein
MRGALKITYLDGHEEYYDVEPIGDKPDFVPRFEKFLSSPNVTLVTDSEILVIPSTSIRHLSITRTDHLPLEELDGITGVVVGAKRIVA